MSLPIIPKPLEIPTTPTPAAKGKLEKLKSLFTTEWSQEKINQAIDHQKKELMKALVTLDNRELRGRFGDDQIRKQLEIIEDRVLQILKLENKNDFNRPKGIKIEDEATHQVQFHPQVDKWIHDLEINLLKPSIKTEQFAVFNEFRDGLGIVLTHPNLQKQLGKEERKFLEELRHKPTFTTEEFENAIDNIETIIHRNKIDLKELPDLIKKIRTNFEWTLPFDIHSAINASRSSNQKIDNEFLKVLYHIADRNDLNTIDLNKLAEQTKRLNTYKKTLIKDENGKDTTQYQLINPEIRKKLNPILDKIDKNIPFESAEHFNTDINLIDVTLSNMDKILAANNQIQNIITFLKDDKHEFDKQKSSKFLEKKFEGKTFTDLEKLNAVIETASEDLIYLTTKTDHDINNLKTENKTIIPDKMKETFDIARKRKNLSPLEVELLSIQREIAKKQDFTFEQKKQLCELTEKLSELKYLNKDPNGSAIGITAADKKLLDQLAQEIRSVKATNFNADYQNINKAINSASKCQNIGKDLKKTISDAYGISGKEPGARTLRDSLGQWLSSYSAENRELQKILNTNYLDVKELGEAILKAEALIRKGVSQGKGGKSLEYPASEYLEISTGLNSIHTKYVSLLETTQANLLLAERTQAQTTRELIDKHTTQLIQVIGSIHEYGKARKPSNGEEAYQLLINMQKTTYYPDLDSVQNALKNAEKNFQIYTNALKSAIPKSTELPNQIRTTALAFNQLYKEIESSKFSIKIASQIALDIDQKDKLLKAVNWIDSLKTTLVIDENGKKTTQFRTLTASAKVYLNQIYEHVNNQTPYSVEKFNSDIAKFIKVYEFVAGISVFNSGIEEIVTACIGSLIVKNPGTMSMKTQDVVNDLNSIRQKTYSSSEKMQKTIGTIEKIIENNTDLADQKKSLNTIKELYKQFLPPSIRSELPTLSTLSHAIANRQDLNLKEKDILFSQLVKINKLKESPAFDEIGKKTTLYELLPLQIKKEIEGIFNRTLHGDPYMEGITLKGDLYAISLALESVEPNVERRKIDIGEAIHNLIAVCKADPFYEKALENWKDKANFERLSEKTGKQIADDLDENLKNIKLYLQTILKLDTSSAPFRPSLETIAFIKSELKEIQNAYNHLPALTINKYLIWAVDQTSIDPTKLESTIRMAKKIEKRDDLTPDQKNRFFSCAEQIVRFKEIEIKGQKNSIYQLLSSENRKALDQLLQHIESNTPFSSTSAFDALILKASQRIGYTTGVEDQLMTQFNRARDVIIDSPALRLSHNIQTQLRNLMAGPVNPMPGVFQRKLQKAIETVESILIQNRDKILPKDEELNGAIDELLDLNKTLNQFLPTTLSEYIAGIEETIRTGTTPKEEEKYLLNIAYQIHNQTNLDSQAKIDLFEMARYVFDLKHTNVLTENGKNVTLDQLLIPQNKAIINQVEKKLTDAIVYSDSADLKADLAAVKKAANHIENVLVMNSALHELLHTINETPHLQSLIDKKEHDELLQMAKTNFIDVEKLTYAMAGTETIFNKAANHGEFDPNTQTQISLNNEAVRAIRSQFRKLKDVYVKNLIAPEMTTQKVINPELLKIVFKINNRQDITLEQKEHLFTVARDLMMLKTKSSDLLIGKQTLVQKLLGESSTPYSLLTSENKKSVDQLLKRINDETPYPSKKDFETELRFGELVLAQTRPPALSDVSDVKALFHNLIKLVMDDKTVLKALSEKEKEQLNSITNRNTTLKEDLAQDITEAKKILLPLLRNETVTASRKRAIGDGFSFQIGKAMDQLPSTETSKLLEENPQLSPLAQYILARGDLNSSAKKILIEHVEALIAFQDHADFKNLDSSVKRSVEALLQGVKEGTTTTEQIREWQEAFENPERVTQIGAISHIKNNYYEDDDQSVDFTAPTSPNSPLELPLVDIEDVPTQFLQYSKEREEELLRQIREFIDHQKTQSSNANSNPNTAPPLTDADIINEKILARNDLDPKGKKLLFDNVQQMMNIIKDNQNISENQRMCYDELMKSLKAGESVSLQQITKFMGEITTSIGW